MKGVRWVLAGLVVYLVFLIAKLPASQALGFVTLPKELSVQGVSGTIWSGSAQRIMVAGLPIDRVRWSLAFIPLLTGNVALELDAGSSRDTSAISVKGPVRLSTSGVVAEGLHIFLPTDLVIAQLPLPIPVNAEGRFRIKLDTLEYTQRCEKLNGTGQWLNAKVAGMQGMIALGNFDADLSCIEGDPVITVKEPNAFGLSATARVPANMNISVQGQFKPSPDLPDEVHQAARFFGKPNSQGYYQIKF